MQSVNLGHKKMEIKKLTLNNLGRFENLEVDFAPIEDNQSNVTVFIGNNGAGKTSILEALATSLSWFIENIREEEGTGNSIEEMAIFDKAPAASITLQVVDDAFYYDETEKSSYKWTIVKARDGQKSKKFSEFKELYSITDSYRQRLTDNAKESLPLVVYYPIDRLMIGMPKNLLYKDSLKQIQGYDESLNQTINFTEFFYWFKEREDIENEEESRRFDLFLEKDFDEFTEVDSLISNYEERIEKIDITDIKVLMAEFGNIKKAMDIIKRSENDHQDKQLNAVRTAISSFMPDLSNIRVQRKPRLHMAVDKDGKSLNVLQLSQGEKSLMALVGDIARRLAMMNPKLDNPLHGDGIILIDEIDMHLHPSWQRNLVQRFTDTFPNCQIVLSTHSPLVISDQKDILVYLLNDGDITALPPLYGEDVNTVLLEAMDTNIRDPKVDKKLRDLLDLIQENKLTEAKKLHDELAKKLSGNNIELIKARLIMRKKELRYEKD